METKVIRPGKILVAHPDFSDQNFRDSVVLITEFHSKGTVGFMLNKRTDYNFADVIQESGVEWPYPDFLYNGGPVNKTALVCVHSAEWFSSNTYTVNSELSISSDKMMTEKMAMGNLPRYYRFVTGMAGWQPGQLEQEIKKNYWLTGEPTLSVLFDECGTKQWKQSIELCASQAVDSFF